MTDETRAPVANRGAITVSIMLATFMQGVDTTIANVALPHMQGSFSAAQDQIAWVVTSYSVAAAIMTPLTGWLAGRILGRQPRDGQPGARAEALDLGEKGDIGVGIDLDRRFLAGPHMGELGLLEISLHPNVVGRHE